MCSVSEADEEVQVQSAASSDIVTTLEQDIQRMTAIGTCIANLLIEK